MLQRLSLAHIAEATQGSLHLSGSDIDTLQCNIESAITDSRSLKPNCVFFALIGERFDAHDFLGALSSNENVLALVVSRPPQQARVPYILVRDTTEAYGRLAAWLRQQWPHPLAAITGSCGKTTVKTLLASICQQQGKTLATEGNLNNHIGVPHTLFALEPDHQYAVVEMGASGLGEIAYLAHLASPQVALVNNAMPAHVEGFGSLAAIVQEKGQIYSALQPDGVAILNLDDPHADQWRDMIGDRKILGFSADESSTDNKGDVRAEKIRMNAQGCADFVMQTPEGCVDISLNVIGRHNVSNALAAASCALALGIRLDNIAMGLKAAESASGRLELLRVNDHLQLINDAYNANPGSVKVGVDCLVEQAGWRCLVLGDMAELGDEAAQSHRDIGAYAATQGVDALLLCGKYAEETRKGYLSACRKPSPIVDTFLTHEALNHRLMELCSQKASDQSASATVLVKGSRSSQMNRVADSILNDKR